MRLGLIPEGHRRNIVLERQIEATGGFPSQRLHRDSQVFLESDRIHDMPAVETKTRLRLRLNHLRHARIGRAEFLILARSRLVEAVRAAEVILRPGPADRREFLVAVHKELNFAFTPPARAVRAPRHVRPDVVAASSHAFDNRVVRFIGKGIGPAELRVEVCHILRHGRQRVVDLVVQDHGFVRHIGHRNLESFAKRHHPIAVESAAGIHTDR